MEHMQMVHGLEGQSELRIQSSGREGVLEGGSLRDPMEKE